MLERWLRLRLSLYVCSLLLCERAIFFWIRLIWVAKALELFMDRIIKAVADETKSRGAKRVTPSHLYVSLDRADGPLRNESCIQSSIRYERQVYWVLLHLRAPASQTAVSIGFLLCNDSVNGSICFPLFEDEG
jgi:hypothetical protein